VRVEAGKRLDAEQQPVATSLEVSREARTTAASDNQPHWPSTSMAKDSFGDFGEEKRKDPERLTSGLTSPRLLTHRPPMIFTSSSLRAAQLPRLGGRLGRTA
jgi:hypothetical protein